MISQSKRLLFSCYISMFLIGITATLIGAIAPALPFSTKQIGYIISSQNMGFLTALIFSGFLADYFRKNIILLIGALLASAAFFTLNPHNSYLVFTIAVIIAGFAGGIFEGTADPFTIELDPQNQARHININHFAVTSGSIAIILLLLSKLYPWNIYTTIFGFTALVLAGMAYRYNPSSILARPHKINYKTIYLISKQLLPVFSLSTLAIGLELTTIGFVSSHVTKNLAFSIEQGQISLLLFLGGLAFGRFLLSLYNKFSILFELLMVSFGASIISFGLLFMIPIQNTVLLYNIVFMAGLSCSCIFPVLVLLRPANKTHPSTAIAMLKLAVPTAGSLVPFIIAMLLNITDLQKALLIIPTLAVMGVLLGIIFKQALIGKASSQEET